MSRGPSRRLVVAGGIGAGVGLGLVGAGPGWRAHRQPAARVRVFQVDRYDDAFSERLAGALAAYPAVVARARGGVVFLKPNLVEARPGKPVVTEPAFVVAVAEAFRRLGARTVRVGDGPGHTRDTEAALAQTGLAEALAERGLWFIDLNVDDVALLRPPLDLAGHGRIPVARGVLEADLLVSLPKLKTHHHAGVTLGMKNLFGVVPGAVWGWPKNPLHWGGLARATVDLWTGLRPHLTIVDGRVGMEGDGHLDGEAVDHGLVLLGEQACAVDATASRLMGIDPTRLETFRLAAAHGGTVEASRIQLEGDAPRRRDYALPPGFEAVRLGEAAWG